MKHKKKKEEHEHSGDNILIHTSTEINEPTKEIIAMTRQYLELQSRYEDQKKITEKLYEETCNAELLLYERMKDTGIEQFRTVEFGLISCANTLYGKITDLVTAEKWLKENGLYNELLKLTPIKGRVNELLKKRMEDGLPIPPGFDYVLKRTIGHRNK